MMLNAKLNSTPRRNISPNTLSDAEILITMKEEYYRVSPTGCHDFFKKSNLVPSLPYLTKRFSKTYNELLLLAGVPEQDLNFVRRDKEDYLCKLISVANLLGHTPTADEFREQGYCPEMLMKFYGTYNNAIQEAGLEINVKKTACIFTKAELKRQYLSLNKKLGRPASWNDLNNNPDISNANVFTIRFGGMQGLKESLGIEPSTRRPKSIYSKEYLTELLIQEAYNQGRHLTVSEIKNNDRLPCHTTILKYFKTTNMDDVWKEISLEIIKRGNIKQTTNTVAKEVTHITRISEAGKMGEKNVCHQLDFLNKNKYVVYNDIKLISNGRFQQIDHLVIGPNGIFPIETKNLSGEISISNNGCWSRTIRNLYEVIENPTGQVLRHETIIRELTKDQHTINSIIVLANNASKVSGTDRNPIPVVKADMLLHYINNFKSETILTSENIQRIKLMIETNILKDQSTTSLPTAINNYPNKKGSYYE